MQPKGQPQHSSWTPERSEQSASPTLMPAHIHLDPLHTHTRMHTHTFPPTPATPTVCVSSHSFYVTCIHTSNVPPVRAAPEETKPRSASAFAYSARPECTASIPSMLTKLPEHHARLAE